MLITATNNKQIKLSIIHNITLSSSIIAFKRLLAVAFERLELWHTLFKLICKLDKGRNGLTVTGCTTAVIPHLIEA